MKKNQDNAKRRLTLYRETIQRLEDPQLLEQVQGGTSQWLCTTSRTNYNNNEISGDC